MAKFRVSGSVKVRKSGTVKASSSIALAIWLLHCHVQSEFSGAWLMVAQCYDVTRI